MGDNQKQINQVYKSGKILKDILGWRAEKDQFHGRDEYAIDDIPEYSDADDLKDIDPDFGYNFSVEHKYIKGWKLHIRYIKFPEPDTKPNNINITRANIESVKEEIFGEDGEGNREDNVIIVLPFKTTTAYDTYINYVDTINMHNEKPDGTSDLAKRILNWRRSPAAAAAAVTEESDSEADADADAEQVGIGKNIKYTLRHMNNIQILHINALNVNILEHEMVPKHEIIRNYKEIKRILKEHNCSNKTQFPVIQKHDAVAEILGLVPGDMVKIYRSSIASGESVFYRICK